MNSSQLLAMIPLVPLLAMLAILASARWPNVREAVSLLAGLLLFGLVVTLVRQVESQVAPSFVLA